MPPAYVFLKIDGISGESTDEKHKDWIEILSFSHGMNQPTSGASGSGGRSSARVNMADFSVAKEVDKSSPYLAQACCDGRHIKEVKVELCQSTQDKHTYMMYTMENVIISGFTPGGTGDGSKPMENVTFNFGKIKWEYTPIGHDGKPGSKVGPMGWNLEENKKI